MENNTQLYSQCKILRYGIRIAQLFLEMYAIVSVSFFLDLNKFLLMFLFELVLRAFP